MEECRRCAGDTLRLETTANITGLPMAPLNAELQTHFSGLVGVLERQRRISLRLDLSWQRCCRKIVLPVFLMGAALHDRRCTHPNQRAGWVWPSHRAAQDDLQQPSPSNLTGQTEFTA